MVPTAWQAQQFPAVWQPKLRVVIAGRDRIRFTGLPTYQPAFWGTDAHGFCSRPYPLSWNLFEALACATPLVLSESVAYRSTVPETTGAVWVNLDQPPSITAGIRHWFNGTTRKD